MNRDVLWRKVVRPGDRIFVTIEVYKGKEGPALSVTGVDGPMATGDAKGSCGQIVDYLEGIAVPGPGWTRESITRLWAVWKRWHLNDMRAGCEHQRLAEWDKRPIDPGKPLNSYGKHCGSRGPTTWNMLTWVTRREHPEGLMCEPCPVCGYKYGTAWLHEPLPEETQSWLQDLPETDIPLPGAWAR